MNFFLRIVSEARKEADGEKQRKHGYGRSRGLWPLLSASVSVSVTVELSQIVAFSLLLF